jgi:hypothetical protein
MVERRESAKHNPWKVGRAWDSVSITVAAIVGDVINVALQFKLDGVDVAERVSVFAYLSDDANGDSVAATAPTGGVTIGTDGVAIPLVAGKAFQLISEADGDLDLDVEDSGADTWYLVIVLPDGSLQVSGAIAIA